jgi:para-aminobenzoate synthetase component 1
MNPGPNSYSARIKSSAIDCPAGLDAFLNLPAFEHDCVLLESSATHSQLGRHSIIAHRPIETITLEAGLLKNSAGNVLAAGGEAMWTALRNAFSSVRLLNKRSDEPYLPGWFGYVGYEVGQCVEKLPCRANRDTHLPDLRLTFHDAILIYDAIKSAWTLVELEFTDPPPGAGQAGLALRKLASQAAVFRQPAIDGFGATPNRCLVGGAGLETASKQSQSNFTADQYRSMVGRAIEYIAAGDIFQVNLSQRFAIPNSPGPLEMYRVLRLRNPAWYSALLTFTNQGRPCGIISSSPELFLRVRDGLAITRPIKGTRRRIGDAQADTAARADLLASPKDNAELAMIVDLLRNDLGRACKYGSVKVTSARQLEVHPTVFHLVAEVQGQLKPGVGPAELLRATFPGGSITGCPKIRAMEIIDELEGIARGVYTGCIGTVGVDGSCEWNIAIRTIVYDGGTSYVQAGGGIVADSSQEGEYQETLDKARALLEAIEQAGG